MTTVRIERERESVFLSQERNKRILVEVFCTEVSVNGLKGGKKFHFELMEWIKIDGKWVKFWGNSWCAGEYERISWIEGAGMCLRVGPSVNYG